MTTDLNTLPTALYVKIDDHLGRSVRTGRPPRLTDAELLTLAVAQALLGIRSESRRLRFLPRHLPGAFPTCHSNLAITSGSGTAVPLPKKVIRLLAADTDLWTDATWVVDSTPVECGRSRETTKRPELAGWAGLRLPRTGHARRPARPRAARRPHDRRRHRPHRPYAYSP